MFFRFTCKFFCQLFLRPLDYSRFGNADRKFELKRKLRRSDDDDDDGGNDVDVDVPDDDDDDVIGSNGSCKFLAQA